MKALNLKGKIFGRLQVIRKAENKGTITNWECVCSCGNNVITRTHSLVQGRTTSCGCYFKEQVSKRFSKHNLVHMPIYKVWASMKDRCNNPKNKGYKNYGGRGIKCKWNSFEEFYSDMGAKYKAGLSIDRIDNNGNYSKKNCRWATREIQNNNTRNNHVVADGLIKKNISQWAKELNVKPRTLNYWINKKKLTIKQIKQCKINSK